MRHIGFVKWFGAYDSYSNRLSDYGFIERINKSDIFVHYADVLSKRYLHKDDLITFEVELNEETNKTKAVKVKLLEDEDDIDFIKRLAFSNNNRINFNAFPIYLNKIDFIEAKSLLKEKLDQPFFDTYKLELISKLSIPFFKEFPKLRSFLNYKDHFKICINLANTENQNEEEKVKLYAEALGCLPKHHSSDQEFISQIPKEYLLKYSLIREKLQTGEHYEICIKLLNENKFNQDYVKEILSEIISLTNDLKDYNKSYYFDSMPDFLLKEMSDLRKNLSVERHLSILLEMINNNRENPGINENLISELYNCLTHLSKDSDLWTQIPSDLFNQNKSFRLLLPLPLYLKTLIKFSNNSEIENDELDVLKNKIIDKYQGMNYLTIDELFLDDEINSFLLKNHIFNSLPEKAKAHLIVHNINNLSNEEISIAVSLIAKLEPYYKEIILNKLGDIFLLNERRLFNLLKPNHQIEILINNDYSSEDEWDNLNDSARLHLFFYFLKSNFNLDFFINKLKDVSAPLQFAIKLAKAKNNQEEKDKYFTEGHNNFQNYVVEKAWNQNELLDFEPLLPSCKPNIVKYCETRPWPTDEDKQRQPYRVTRAFCPRARKECELNSLNFNYRLSGARLYADLNLPWQEWSLLELLEYSEIKPKVSNLSNSLEYVPRLSGWINRLNEIRERLKCSKCGEPLVPNQKYAKNLASYNVTVASCNKGIGHDTNIYFNHCWACREIIDSRESKIQVEGFYLCIHCGSGPQKSDTYTQGNVCPKCGNSKIKTENIRDKICFHCSHKFTIPPQNYLTGR